MSDRPADRDDDDREDRHLDTEETSGLGLTEEFARIESEIGSATGEHRSERDETGEPAEASEPAESAGSGETGESAEIEAQEPAPQPPPADEATSEWDTIAETGDQEWVVEEDAPRGDTGSWETGEHDADHDTGEWIGATDEAEATVAAEHGITDDHGVTGDQGVTGEHGTTDDRGVTGEHGDTGEDHPAATGEHPEHDEDPVTGEEPHAGRHEVPDELREPEEPASDELPIAAAAADQPKAPAAPAAKPRADQTPPTGAPEAESPPKTDPATRVQQSAPLFTPSSAASVERPTEVRRPPATDSGSLTPIPPGPVAVAGGYGDDDLEIKVPKLWLRFLSASVVIVAATAAAVAVTGLLFISDIAKSIQPLPGVQDQLTAVESDQPQTVLIIGSDRRADQPASDARSDTTMLLRIDPQLGLLSLFSLPRDLEVPIPGYSDAAKLNEAYTVGGAEKTLETVKDYTGLKINHVVEINFAGFADAVNAIDCVYIDVDRDYEHSNTGLSDLDSYSEIDINAGYQRLCGLKALQYVRYRHTDTDIVRAARQQDFLREARQKVNPRELIPAPIIGGDTGNQLIDIFTKYTRSDIDSADQILGILKSFIAVRSTPVNQVKFEGDLGDATNTNVTTTPKQLQKALDKFRYGPEQAPVVEPTSDSGSKPDSGGGSKGGKSDGGKDKKPSDPLADANVIPVDQLADPTAFENDGNKNGRRLDFPVFSPTVVAPDSTFDTGSRTYEFENEDNKKEDAYKTVIEYTPGGAIPEYYGVMGTTWDDPPILRDPSETRTVDGDECEAGSDGCFMLFYDGDRLRLVGWQEGGNSYWVNNTLNRSLSEDQMLAIATTMRRID